MAALAAGMTDSGQTAVTIPQGTAPGTYYIIAAADGTNGVAETVETNNTRAILIQISSAS